jgi:hypothetical protein
MTTLAELARWSPAARARVLAEYRVERRYDRPFVAAHAVMTRHALHYATGAAVGIDEASPTQVSSLALFVVADALRAEVRARTRAQAHRRGVEEFASFWHSGAVKP